MKGVLKLHPHRDRLLLNLIEPKYQAFLLCFQDTPSGTQGTSNNNNNNIYIYIYIYIYKTGGSLFSSFGVLGGLRGLRGSLFTRHPV